MRHLNARRRRASTPAQSSTEQVEDLTRFPITERWVNDPNTHETIELVVKLIRTPPGTFRNKMLSNKLDELFKGTKDLPWGTR